MRAEHSVYFNNSRIWGEDLVPVKMHLSPRWLRLLSVLRRWFCYDDDDDDDDDDELEFNDASNLLGH